MLAVFSRLPADMLTLCACATNYGYSDLKATNADFASPKTGMGIAWMVAFFARSSQRGSKGHATTDPRVHMRGNAIMGRREFSALSTFSRVRLFFTFFRMLPGRSGHVSK